MPSDDTGGFFPRTRWSIIIEARGDGTEAETALAELISMYWRPIYASFRDLTKSQQDAEDLTQSLILSLIERGDLKNLDPQKGRFRSFLRAAIKHFKANDYDYRSAQKRGGGIPPLSLDTQQGEDLLQREPCGSDDPTTAFDRRWIRSILDDCAEELRREWSSQGKADEYALLEDFLIPNARTIPYKKVAILASYL